MVLQNIFFFLAVIAMMFVLGIGTIAVPLSDLPIFVKIILEILIVWCDLIGIFAIVNRIQSIIDYRKEIKKLNDKKD